MAFIVRAFQYAWPPLAYSITDDAQAARFYGLVTTYYVFVSGWVVAGDDAARPVGAAPARRPALPRARRVQGAARGSRSAGRCTGCGWCSWSSPGGSQVTRRNFPASRRRPGRQRGALLVLVGPLGIAGAGIALCGAYVVMLGVMYVLTRRAFAVDFEWRRLSQVVLVAGGIAVAGELLLPTHGAVGLVLRAAAVAAIPAVLWVTRFVTPAELAGARSLWGRLVASTGADSVSPRPPVSVVMPFAGTTSEGERALQILQSLDLGPQDERILVDNAGVLGERPRGGSSRRASARRPTRATPALRAPAASGSCSSTPTRVAPPDMLDRFFARR